MSRTIFSGAGDRLAQKMTSCIESYKYVKVYDEMLSMLVCSCAGCDRFFCTIFSGTVYRLASIGYPNRQVRAKPFLFAESYDCVKFCDGNAQEFFIYFIICSDMIVI